MQATRLAIAALTFAALSVSAAFAQGPAGSGITATAMLDRLILMDTNHDGAISTAELETGREAVFARLDANHDGLVTPDEVPQLGGALGPLAQADADHEVKLSHPEYVSQPSNVPQRLDTSHDGNISADEIAVARVAMQNNGGN